MSIANGDQSISIEGKMDMSLVSGRVINKTPSSLRVSFPMEEIIYPALLMLRICPYLSAEKHRLLGQYFPVV